MNTATDASSTRRTPPSPVKALLKRAMILPVARKIRWWLSELERSEAARSSDSVVDNSYAWLTQTFLEVIEDRICARKPMYTWGVLQGAALARVLGVPRISVIEFGVAGGNGLISLEENARIVAEKTGVQIEVYGFDTGTGLPRPTDYRDQPNMWFEGQLAMRPEQLKSQLSSASLIVGQVRDTVPDWLGQHRAPVGFISFDLDLYTSTRDALAVLAADPERLLPRVTCYFDDILGHSYHDFGGERLAIREFNERSDRRKLSPIYGLGYFVPYPFRQSSFWDCIYFGHCFDHPQYNRLDSFRKAVSVDAQGRVGTAVVQRN